MENENLLKNLYLKQFNQSNAIAYNKSFVANPSDYNFQLLDNAYREAGIHYAQLKIAIDSNKCFIRFFSFPYIRIKCNRTIKF